MNSVKSSLCTSRSSSGTNSYIAIGSGSSRNDISGTWDGCRGGIGGNGGDGDVVVVTNVTRTMAAVVHRCRSSRDGGGGCGGRNSGKDIGSSDSKLVFIIIDRS